MVVVVLVVAGFVVTTITKAVASLGTIVIVIIANRKIDTRKLLFVVRHFFMVDTILMY